RDPVDLLQNDARAEGIAASHLAHELAALEHLGDELVAREQEHEPARVLVPNLAGDEAEAGEADLLLEPQHALGATAVGVERNGGRPVRGKPPGRLVQADDRSEALAARLG